ncbi:MAG TPA: CotH kinase family protein, partial [Vicinamibacterales bacterium]|nr:CotH kinase family protein [Vicinamibacterales bacterium]
MQLKHMSRDFTGLLAGLAILALSPSAVLAEPPKSASELFTTTKVWTVHLEFTPEEWARIEPKGGQQGPGVGPGGPGGMRGPAGPGGLGGLLSASFMKGDANGDGRLSQEEFAALGRTWFAAWDKSASGKLSAEQLRDGLNAAFPPPAMFGGPGGGRGPGGPSFNGANGRNGLSAAMGIDFQYVNATVDFDGARIANIAARYKGNATFMQSRGTVKRPFKLDLSEYVKGQKLAGQSKINLHNGVTDPSWMNEVLSYRAFRDAGVPSPRTSYAKLYVTVPGTHDRRYFGLYAIVEEVDSAFVQDRYASKDGAIFKPSTRQLFEYQGDDWAKYNQQYDPKTKLTPAQIERVISFAKLVSNASDEEFRKAAAQYVDLDEFARFMAVNVWLTNLDSILGMGQNFYVYLNARTNKFEFLPWDLDHSFGQFPMGGSQEQREKLSIDRPWSGQVKLLERMFAVPEFRDKYRARLAEYRKSIFDP